ALVCAGGVRGRPEVDLLVGPLNLNVLFFSSRRRHTRWGRDWSSDVCSSDLGQIVRFTAAELERHGMLELVKIEVAGEDRQSVVQGKSVDLGGRRIIKKK